MTTHLVQFSTGAASAEVAWRLLSSELILDAEQAMAEFGYDIGPDGLLTYVWDDKVASCNPGYCFKKAGRVVRGRSADDKKTLLGKYPPAALEAVA